MVGVSRLGLACCGFVLLIAGAADAERPKVGDAAPPIGLERVLQAPPDAVATWDGLRGKVVVLEFWATWCGPCVAAVPHLNELAEKYQVRGVQFIAVTDEAADVVEPFLKKKPIHSWIGLDADRSMFTAYGVTGIPHTVIVGRDGTVLGVTWPAQLTAQVLDDALAGRKPDLPATPEGMGTVAGIDPAEASAEPPLYQVLIRPRAAGSTSMSRGPGKLTLDGYDLKRMCAVAWDVRPERVVLGDESSEHAYTAVVVAPPGHEEELLPMLRRALESTFGVRVRRESRDTEGFVLGVCDSGVKLKETATSGSYSSAGNGTIEAVGMRLTDLAATLEGVVGKPVFDETGLAARYDIRLAWKDGDRESLERALREQSGLTLAPARRPTEVLVVETAAGR